MRKARFMFYVATFVVFVLVFSFGIDYATNFGSGFVSVLAVTLSSFYSIRKKVAKAIADDKTGENGNHVDPRPLHVRRGRFGRLANSFAFSCSLIRFVSFLLVSIVLVLLLEFDLFSVYPYLIGLVFGNACILISCILR